MTAQDLGLRDKQTQLTRDLVLDALAEVIADQGVSDFSVQDVADRAGVSHRTVYRHFETREAMTDALVARLEERARELGATVLPTTPDEIIPSLSGKFAIMEELGPSARAVLMLDAARLKHSEMAARSIEATRASMSGITQHLSPEAAEGVIALIHQIGSTRMWLSLTEETGMDAERCFQMAAWTISNLIRELEAGRGPGIS
jgi:AcrR family transcriptional regulator